MRKRTPMLTKRLIEVNASNMNRPEDGARFELPTGNPGDVHHPTVLGGTSHPQHATDALYTTMLYRDGRATSATDVPSPPPGTTLRAVLPTSGGSFTQMLNGLAPNDEPFGIALIPPFTQARRLDRTACKRQPNIGVSVYREFLPRAKNNARLANVFKT